MEMLIGVFLVDDKGRIVNGGDLILGIIATNWKK